MLLGALIDAGVSEQKLRAMLKRLPINGYELVINKVVKAGISSTYLDVHLHHHHEHIYDHGPHHEHRHFSDIVKIIDDAELDINVKEISKKVFLKLAEAEAKVHGTTIENVHFHEVGAVDTIIDIVGTVWALNYLGIEQIYTSKVNTGYGFVKCSHGIMPVPAPATAELLTGVPHYQGGIEKELVTPTGAALISVLSTGFGPIPENFISKKIAYGAGTFELEFPNVVRMHIGEVTGNSNKNNKIVVEANIDDLNPQVYEYVMDKLLDVGALDVWLTPIIMKKSRPATLLSVLLNSTELDKVCQIIFAETTTIGIRFYQVGRKVAERSFVTVHLEWGPVQVKISSFNGEICSISPEYNDCRRLAGDNSAPLKQIQHQAINLTLEKLNRFKTSLC